ncbi:MULTISPECIES: GntG family PLP-dependent aldolase [unclassified Bradyrhizobium]|uniref:GntG family PLP-dependent aldolase n=1 Tax=unclassified Bradyrhizobium TaxID=2631580 RepID=UPI002915DD54|nr:MULTISPECIES: GntG family PLP-dependent aldolase [unclassified Bradyrhizobium]
MLIDLRSDTCTKPTARMRHAMATADVGDDGYGEDPTVNKLEALAAARLGMEAACLVTSGIQGNLTAILAQCAAGQKVILGDESDIYNYEAGGLSVLGGLVMHPVSTLANGTLPLDRVAMAIGDPSDPQCAPATLITVETPHVRGGGIALPIRYLEELRQLAIRFRLKIHLDGARIFNASAALGVDVARISSYADTVQICLSKSLGAPIGSVVVGDRETIGRARRWRKMLGGTMRQAGVIAAAGIVAIEEMSQRLEEDHRRTYKLAVALSSIPGIILDLTTVQTNMVFFRLQDMAERTSEFLAELNARGIRMNELGYRKIRAVVTYHHSDEDIDIAADAIRQVTASMRNRSLP